MVVGVEETEPMRRELGLFQHNIELILREKKKWPNTGIKFLKGKKKRKKKEGYYCSNI